MTRSPRRPVPFGLRFIGGATLLFGAIVGVLGIAQLAVLTELPLTSPRPGRAELRDRTGRLVAPALDHAAHRFMPAGEGIEGHAIARVFLAAEDHRLFAHAGVDFRAVLRASLALVRTGTLRSGASTMAMQLVRLREGRRPGVHLWHKLRDCVLALRLTRALGPAAMLRAYLDEVPLGPRIVGVEAGARAAFGKPARELSLAEAAVLSSFPRSPSSLARAPRSLAVRERIRLRALAVLGVLAREGESIGEATAAVPVLVEGLVGERAHPIGASASARFGHGGHVVSTLDLALQRVVEGALRAGLARTRERGVSHASAILVDLATMSVRAACTLADGGEPWFDGTEVRRQPGSTLKPLLAALALEEHGEEDFILEDVPLAYEGDEGAYEPRNYDGRFHGAVPIEDVVARSLNVPTLRLAARLGTGRVLEFFRRAGLRSLKESPNYYGVNVALGDGEVTLSELVEAYGALAHEGVARPLRLDEEARVTERRVTTVDVARVVSHMLDDDRRRAPSFERDGVFSAPYALAAKTGTARDHRDAWAIGYSRTMVAGVWFGRADGGPTREVNGARGPGPVLRAILDATHPPEGPFPEPDPDTWEERSVFVEGARVGVSRERRAYRRRGPRPPTPVEPRLTSQFVFPVAGARFLVDPSRSPGAQAIRVVIDRRTNARGATLVRDGALRVDVRGDGAIALPLTPGLHQLELVDDGRVVDTRDVEVRTVGSATFPP